MSVSSHDSGSNEVNKPGEHRANQKNHPSADTVNQKQHHSSRNQEDDVLNNG